MSPPVGLSYVISKHWTLSSLSITLKATRMRARLWPNKKLIARKGSLPIVYLRWLFLHSDIQLLLLRHARNHRKISTTSSFFFYGAVKIYTQYHFSWASFKSQTIRFLSLSLNSERKVKKRERLIVENWKERSHVVIVCKSIAFFSSQ